MSMKKSAMLMTALAAFALSSNPPVTGSTERKRILSPNERRKCFYKYCKNMRPNSTDLYCCDECKVKAREMEAINDRYKKEVLNKSK